MADFAAVLQRTINALPDNGPEKREQVYAKARAVVATKLAAISPPPAASVADRQKWALEDAISEVEAGYASREHDPFVELEKVLAASAAKRQPEAPAETEIAEVLPATPPSEPEISRGPKFGLKDGMLSGNYEGLGNLASPSIAGIHAELRRAIAQTSLRAVNVENKFPELVNALREYGHVLEPPTAELDAVNVWSLGGALASFEQAYREQNAARTLSDPLEPELAAALNNVARMHGALVMGIDETRELVESADQFLLDRNRLEQVELPGSVLLRELTENKALVERNTRQQYRPIYDFACEFGWGASRTGYAAYLSVRNGMITLIRLAVGKDKNALNTIGGVMAVSIAAGDPNFEFMRAASMFIGQYSQTLLAFFNHSPEFRAYVEWAVDLLETERRVVQNHPTGSSTEA